MWQNWFSERNSQTENKTILELLWLLLRLSLIDIAVLFRRYLCCSRSYIAFGIGVFLLHFMHKYICFIFNFHYTLRAIYVSTSYRYACVSLCIYVYLYIRICICLGLLRLYASVFDSLRSFEQHIQTRVRQLFRRLKIYCSLASAHCRLSTHRTYGGLALAHICLDADFCMRHEFWFEYRSREAILRCCQHINEYFSICHCRSTLYNVLGFCDNGS